MFPDSPYGAQQPQQGAFGGLQQPMQQPQLPPVNAPAPGANPSPMQSPWSQFQGGSTQPPDMPDPSQMMQGDAWQRMLAEIRARQGQQQQPPSPAGNLQSMLGMTNVR